MVMIASIHYEWNVPPYENSIIFQWKHCTGENAVRCCNCWRRSRGIICCNKAKATGAKQEQGLLCMHSGERSWNRKSHTLGQCIWSMADTELRIHCILEHIIFHSQPRALNELFPNWAELGAPLHTPATEDSFLVLTEKQSISLPHFLLPPQLNNNGNYIISLSKLTRQVEAD